MTDLRWTDVYPTLRDLPDAPSWLTDRVDPDDCGDIAVRAREAAELWTGEQRTVPLRQLAPALTHNPSQQMRWLPIDSRWVTAMTASNRRTIGDLIDLDIEALQQVRGVGTGSIFRAVTALAHEAADMALKATTGEPQPSATGTPETLDDLLNQVENPDLAARIRAAITQQATTVPEPAPAGEQDTAGHIRARANRMATMYRSGISIDDIADRYQASAGWVRYTIVRYSDVEIPELDINRAHRRGAGEAKRQAERKARSVARSAEDEARLATNQARAQQMAHQLAQPGMTLDAVGKLHGITRERVRQIINEHSGTTVPAIRAQRKQAEAEAERIVLERITREAFAWSEQNPGAPLTEAAKLLDTDVATISQVLGARRGLHRPANEHTLQQWSDDQLLDLLRRYHAETGRTDGDGFEEWGRSVGGPTRQLVALRFGRWNLALGAAGVAQVEPVRHAQVYSDNDLWAAVVEYVASEPDSYAFKAFDAWQRNRPGMPSGALLRFRLGLKWAEIRSSVAAVLAGNQSVDPEWVADITTPRDWSAFRNGARSYAEALDVVREAIVALGPSISSRDYQEWAQANGKPAEATLVRATGLPVWRDVLLAAGGDERPQRPAEVSDERMDAALRHFFTEHPDGTSVDWADWCVGVSDRPSLQTLARRHGSWRDAKKHGMRLLGCPDG